MLTVVIACFQDVAKFFRKWTGLCGQTTCLRRRSRRGARFWRTWHACFLCCVIELLGRRERIRRVGVLVWSSWDLQQVAPDWQVRASNMRAKWSASCTQSNILVVQRCHKDIPNHSIVSFLSDYFLRFNEVRILKEAKSEKTKRGAIQAEYALAIGHCKVHLSTIDVDAR